MTPVLLFVLAWGYIDYVPMDANRCARVVAAIESGDEVKARRRDGSAYNVVSARCMSEGDAQDVIARWQFAQRGGPGA